MHLNIEKEVAALQRLAVLDLRARYGEVFGEQTRAGNKPWLVKRIIWRLQSIAEGDLSERARRRAAELANDADVRLSPPKAQPSDGEARQKSALSDIAMEAGFSDQASFNRAFRQFVGISPGRWRRELAGQ